MFLNLIRSIVFTMLVLFTLGASAQTGLSCENYGTYTPWNAEAWNFTNMKQSKVTFESSSQWLGNGNFKGLLEYKPSGYNFSDKTVKYPIIIFFHGRASRGSGTASHLCRLFKDQGSDLATHKSIPGRVERETALFSQVDGSGTTHKYIVVSPQFHTYNRTYPEPDDIPNNYPSADDVDAVITHLLNVRFAGKIDLRRVYLTGYSNGANMIMEYAGSSVARAKRIAALMPVALCSDLGHFSNDGITAQNVGAAKLKTWFVYCKDDVCGNNVPLEWVNAIKAVPGAETPRLTTLTDPVPNKNFLYNCSDTIEHDSWSRAYDPNFTASFTGDGTGTGSSVNDGVNRNMYQWFTQSLSAVLPVTLKSFHARLIGGKVQLEWVTTDEKDNASFTIERSVGLDNSFKPIGSLPGLKEHTGEKLYSYVDDAPLPNLSYYRLVQTDLDGEKNYFDIRKIINQADGSSVIVSPNPFAGDVSAYVKLDKAQRVLITLTDMTGKVVKTSVGVYAAGSTEIKMGALNLSKGVYILKVAGENISYSTKVIRK